MKKFFILGCAVLAMGAQSVSAGTVTFSLNPINAFDNAFTPIAMPDLSTNIGSTVILEVEVALSVSDLAAGELGIGNTTFDIAFGPGTSDGVDGAGGWTAINPLVDINGPTPPGANTPRWLINGDQGSSTTDLNAIVASIANGVSAAVDPRRTLGQGTPVTLGSFYARWDGLGATTVSVANPFNVMNLNGGVFAGVGTNGAGASLMLGDDVIPEPATVAMAGMGLIGLVAMRRRRKA